MNIFLYTFPKPQVLDSSKLKGFADDNLTIDENDRKDLQINENTVGKGEIARYEQFSFPHSVFQRLVLQTCENQGLFGKGLIIHIVVLDFFKMGAL